MLTFDLLHISMKQKPSGKPAKTTCHLLRKAFSAVLCCCHLGNVSNAANSHIHANLIRNSWACAHLQYVFFFKWSLQHLPPTFIQTIIKQEGNVIP